MKTIITAILLALILSSCNEPKVGEVWGLCVSWDDIDAHGNKGQFTYVRKVKVTAVGYGRVEYVNTIGDQTLHDRDVDVFEALYERADSAGHIPCNDITGL